MGLLTHKPRKIGLANGEYLVAEITSAGSAQQLIAGTTDLNIILLKFEASVANATVLHLEYNSVVATVKYQLANKGSVSWVATDNTKIVLPVGEGLDVYSTVDPNEGWISIWYDLINYSQMYEGNY
jgi:hypothetical protein